MSKEVRFSNDARQSMLKGVNVLVLKDVMWS